ESYVLGEIIRESFRRDGIEAEHKQGMGGTIILWEALRNGQIDVYPEYTGTIQQEILKKGGPVSPSQMGRELAGYGITMSAPLGFNNTYALVMRRSEAARLGIRKISDLPTHPELRFGFTHEFLDRADGWQPLRSRYRLPQSSVNAIDHGLGYSALANGSIDLKDAYSTDAKIAEYDLVALEDDLAFFPRYEAVLLYRNSLPPAATAALRKLEGTIDESRMIRLNAEAERSRNYTLAASGYFSSTSDIPTESFTHQLLRWISRHLELAGVSLLLAILVGVPLGIIASRSRIAGQFILAVVGILQTIPSLALLALLVPVPGLGISSRTAITALFLYGLLPIVRNTASGLQDVSPGIRDSAVALGLSPRAQLQKVFIPMASRSILAGIKTSAVISIGTATLAALIGAGGLGEPILSGLNLNDHVTILKGAVPAACLALLVQGLFDFLDRILIPKGLR
ncbi:MAG TPA: glycine betaine ABC transporter substrate-binding protein, partial [Chthoniobacteraceae bacterium]